MLCRFELQQSDQHTGGHTSDGLCLLRTVTLGRRMVTRHGSSRGWRETVFPYTCVKGSYLDTGVRLHQKTLCP